MNTTFYRCLAIIALAVSLLPLPALADNAHSSPADVFAQLKAMEGRWMEGVEQTEGEPMPDEAPALISMHDFRVTAAGSVVMEVMSSGNDNEMVNMYYMDGDDLVLTHYCAGQNQPTMKLDTEMLAAGKKHFAFTGGTNLDPAVDQHIHAGSWEWQDDGSAVADWTGWNGGEQVGVMHLVLTREE